MSDGEYASANKKARAMHSFLFSLKTILYRNNSRNLHLHGYDLFPFKS